MTHTLRDMGERQLINLIQLISPNKENTSRIGDDCAFIPLDEHILLVSTDIVSQRTHYPNITRPRDMGWFVTAVNLSDIAAKGGMPLGILLAYGLPKDMPVSDFQEIVQGANECALSYHTAIIGGDTKEHNEIVISGTGVGIVDKNECMYRKGAQPGDVLAVTGMLGMAAAGFLSIKQKKCADRFVKGLIHPTPRIFEGRKLAMSRQVHCCMDISDGLSSSLYQLQTCNDVGFSVTASNLPTDALLEAICKKANLPINDYLLHFGGEYELLLCVSPESFSMVQANIAPTCLTAIGQVTEEKSIVLNDHGAILPLENRGYEHFSSHFFS
jgi:thiamine-monophosphate kinase